MARFVEVARDEPTTSATAASASAPDARTNSVECCFAFIAITFTMLFASIHGPSGEPAISIRLAKPFAVLVSFTTAGHAARHHG